MRTLLSTVREVLQFTKSLGRAASPPEASEMPCGAQSPAPGPWGLLVSLHIVTAGSLAEHLTIKIESIFKAFSGKA